MNIQHLKYAVEVEKTGSITQAAENLYMGQPNLSKAIKELENSVGITIFKRTPKGIEITAKGKTFLSYAKNVLLQINEMESLYKTDAPDKQSLSIAVPRCSYVTHAFASFSSTLDMDKELEMDFVETNSLRAIDLVAEGRCNLGIIRYQLLHEAAFLKCIQEKGLRSSALYQFESLALMHASHPLATAMQIDFADLSDYIEILYGDLNIPFAGDALDLPQCRPARRHIYIYDRGSQFDLLTHNPRTYMWVSPMPEDVLTTYNLVQRVCSVQDNIYKDLLIFDKHHHLSSIEQSFIQQLSLMRDRMKSGYYM